MDQGMRYTQLAYEASENARLRLLASCATDSCRFLLCWFHAALTSSFSSSPPSYRARYDSMSSKLILGNRERQYAYASALAAAFARSSSLIPLSPSSMLPVASY